jgi:hypothetical protein
VALLSVAAFLLVLSVLAGRVSGTPSHVTARSTVLLRKVYRTTVVETIVSGGPGSGTSVSQSVSSSGSNALPASAPVTTRTS